MRDRDGLARIRNHPRQFLGVVFIVAMQFVGRMGDEETLYSLAAQLEQALPWSGRRPPNYA